MLVKDIGEFDLIDILAETIGADNASDFDRSWGAGFRLRVSLGDDAAAWRAPEGTTVMTTDSLVEGVHFQLGWTNWRDLGWKSMAVNLSDVAAMGCAPAYSVVTLGLRGDLPVNGVVEMYRGMLEACRQHGGNLVGGDVVRSPVFFVSVTMIGAASTLETTEARQEPLLTRSSARPGDIVAVTGSLGCSGGGLRMFTQDLSFDRAITCHLKTAHNRPQPRVAEGILLARHGVAAAIDVSDGLVDDLGKMCKASQVGAIIHADKVPADDILRRAYPEDWLTLALSGGEDYELLFTASPELMEPIATQIDTPVTVFGHIVDCERGVTVLDENGREINVERDGWDHFRGD